MNMAEYVAIGGIIVNLFALLISVSRILNAATQTEVRTAERFTRLETKTERIESDVQLLFTVTTKRHNDQQT